MLYNNLSGFFRRKYGQRLKKICIDGGFSCPNRDGKCGTGGCIFCSGRGSGDHITPSLPISEQIKTALHGAKDGDKFIAYFQNFTNTYAPTEILKARYDSALIDNRIVALAIGTRPDCIDEKTAELIASYKSRADVWVELGLQSASDEVGRIINRGYDRDVYDRAVKILKQYGIDFVTHMIIGLPTEGKAEALETARYIARSGASGIKIHSIYVSKGTRLEKMYLEKSYTPPTLDEFVDSAVAVLCHLPSDMVVHRLTGDCPKDMLVAPLWNRDKNAILKAIKDKMDADGLYQGIYLND